MLQRSLFTAVYERKTGSEPSSRLSNFTVHTSGTADPLASEIWVERRSDGTYRGGRTHHAPEVFGR